MNCWKKILNAGMFALIISGIFLRFSFLFIAFEYDELFTVITVDPALALGWIVKNWLMIDVHPPLYNVLLYWYNQLYYCTAEWWIRIPSLCFSLAAVWASWRMFPSGLGKGARWTFVGLTACSFQLIHFAPQARSYSLLLLLSVLQMFASLDIWRSVQKDINVPWRKWAFWSVWSVLLCYTHYFGVAVFCASSIMLLGQRFVLKRRFWGLFFCSLGTFGCACLWLIPNFISNWSQKRFSGEWWAAEYRLTEGIFYTAEFLFSSYFIYILVCLACLASVAADFRRVVHKKDYGLLSEKVFLFGVISIVVLTILLMSLKLYLMVPRFFIVLFPYVYLFVSLCLGQYVEKSLLVRAVLVGICAWNVFSFESYALQRYREMPDNAKEFAVHFLTQHKERELFVFVMEGLPREALQAMFSYYIQTYYGRRDISVRVLNTVDEGEIPRLLTAHPGTVIWLPNCSNFKISYLKKQTGLPLVCTKNLGLHCELKLRSPQRIF